MDKLREAHELLQRLRDEHPNDTEEELFRRFAGKLQNWDLARYELRQIKASLEDAVVFYRGIPVELVDATVDPIRAIDAAIEAKDGARFAEGYHALTNACNACHVGIGRSFIVIQVPTASPFSDQSFSPPKSPEQ